MQVKIKICGMKFPENILEVNALQPDYLGFIFYEKSPRNFQGIIPEINTKIKKAGVFVDADFDFILSKVKEHQLETIQLHGNESVSFCKLFKEIPIEVIKVFSVDEDFDFKTLKSYENVCDFYLFDTKGNYRGGNGITFNWKILEKYNLDKPYFLSGGIGIDEVESLKEFLTTEIGKKCYAIDVNSKFEIQPGLKHTQLIKTFKNELSR